MNGTIPFKIAIDLAFEREMELRREVARLQDCVPATGALAAAPEIAAPVGSFLARAATKTFETNPKSPITVHESLLWRTP